MKGLCLAGLEEEASVYQWLSRSCQLRVFWLLQEMTGLLETSIRVLALADAEWQPLSMENHGDLLTLLMSLVSKLIRLHLLARRMPYALIVQLYTLTYNCVQVHSP